MAKRLWCNVKENQAEQILEKLYQYEDVKIKYA